MFTNCNVQVQVDLVCDRSVDTLTTSDFFYYDKDGFELNVAEQKYYDAMGYPLSSILNHRSWQEQWFTVDDEQLILDHCIILHRCAYSGSAKRQLQELVSVNPRAHLLLQTKPKWGYDFALDAISLDGEIYEVIHIEQDESDYETFMSRKSQFEDFVMSIDWKDAARRVWDNREKWIGLKGFEQNNWKSKFVIGWEKAEQVEKCI